jgi:two-component system chemotaxis response regulator CheB
MPRSAMSVVNVDHILPIGEIGPLLTALAREEAVLPAHAAGGHVQPMETDRGTENIATGPADRPGRVSVFTCPECSGTLWEHEESGVLRFRCRVGHVYSPDSMLAAQTDSVDRALWIALRALEERAALTRRLADRARSRNQQWVAGAFDERARAAAEQADVIKQVLGDRSPTHLVPDPNEDGPAMNGEGETFEAAKTQQD